MHAVGRSALADGTDSNHRIDALESLRGIAALAIVFFHLVLVLGIPAPPEFSFIGTHFGLGVPLFYTLSGFVLSYGYADALRDRSDVAVFYVRRLFRIAPLFYTMLVLWIVVYWIVRGTTFSASTLCLNVTFLFGLVPGEHQSVVWAGWSIGVEMLFYLLFPLLAFGIAGIRSALIGFALGCVLSASAYQALAAAGLNSYAELNLVTHLPYFLAGMLGYHCWRATGYARHAVVGWGLLLAMALLVAAITAWPAFKGMVAAIGLERNIWAIGFLLLILSACFARNPVLESGPLRHLGKLSFSIYLLHPMVMGGLIWLQFPTRLAALGLSPLANFATAAVVVLALVWIGSQLSFRWVEQPGMALGRHMVRRMRARGVVPPIVQRGRSAPMAEVASVEVPAKIAS